MPLPHTDSGLPLKRCQESHVLDPCCFFFRTNKSKAARKTLELKPFPVATGDSRGEFFHANGIPHRQSLPVWPTLPPRMKQGQWNTQLAWNTGAVGTCLADNKACGKFSRQQNHLNLRQAKNAKRKTKTKSWHQPVLENDPQTNFYSAAS